MFSLPMFYTVYSFMKHISFDRLAFYLLPLILLFAFATRMYRVTLPKTYYFDEVYHAVTAKLYAHNNPAGYEWWHDAPEPNTAIEWLHPPVAKLFQAGSMYIFGENSFGWRFPSVIFGVGVVWMTYVLALQLTKVRGVALLASFFSAVDGLLLAQSRIAMNDIFLVFFMLCALVFYTRWRKYRKPYQIVVSGILTGLAVATKWSGAFLLPIFFIDTFVVVLKEKKFILLLKGVLSWIILPILIYLLSYSQFWLQGHAWSQFKELHNQIWYYQTHLNATHASQSTPLQWMFDLKPVWMYVDYNTPGKVGNIYNLGNPIVFWGGLITAVWFAVLWLKNRDWKRGFLLLTYLSVWTPWLFSPRIMFSYHYAPAIPLLCIMLALFLADISRKKRLRFLVVTVPLLA
ncbi:MAG: Dolichyl-phosphate-mannose-protein mannosyltransferase family protein, partial [Microgenomates group bacterium GW2011_GWA1_46_15]